MAERICSHTFFYYWNCKVNADVLPDVGETTAIEKQEHWSNAIKLDVRFSVRAIE